MSDDEPDQTSGCTEWFVNTRKEQSGDDPGQFQWTRRCKLCNKEFKGGIQKGKQACHVGHFKAPGVTMRACAGAAWTEAELDKARKLTKAGRKVLQQIAAQEAAEIERALLAEDIMQQRAAADASLDADEYDEMSQRTTVQSFGIQYFLALYH